MKQKAQQIDSVIPDEATLELEEDGMLDENYKLPVFIKSAVQTEGQDALRTALIRIEKAILI